MSSITKLVTQLQKAHAGELGAFWAYLGHTRATLDIQEKLDIQEIKNEEWQHKQTIASLLHRLGEKPSKWRDFLFTCIGKTLGFLCRFAGRKNNLRGALFIEKIGVTNYMDMACDADVLGLVEITIVLKRLHRTELEHEKTLKTYLERNTG